MVVADCVEVRDPTLVCRNVMVSFAGVVPVEMACSALPQLRKTNGHLSHNELEGRLEARRNLSSFRAGQSHEDVLKQNQYANAVIATERGENARSLLCRVKSMLRGRSLVGVGESST